MNRARFIVAATLVGASFVGVTVLAQIRPTPPPMTSVLAGQEVHAAHQGRGRNRIRQDADATRRHDAHHQDHGEEHVERADSAPSRSPKPGTTRTAT